MKKIFLVLPFVLFNARYSNAAAPMCAKTFMPNSVRHSQVDELLDRTKTEKPKLKNVIETIESVEAIDADLILGLKTPTWNDFAYLENIKTAYRASLGEFNGAEKKSVEVFYSQLNQVWKKDNRRSKAAQIPRNESENYGPTDFGLRVAYQAKLLELNKYLPSQARFPEAILAPDMQRNQNYEDSLTVVKSLVRKHDYQMKKAGFNSHKEFVQTLRTGNESSRKSLEILEADQELEFAMARPSNGRFWIEKVGFHNQHVTGSSRGYMGNDGRNAVEASYLNIKKDNYSERNNDFKPKYGYLFPKIGGKFEGRTVHYGDDLYIFKKDEMKSRVTFTIGDSLNAMSSMSKDKWYYGVSYKANRWDQVFTPWSRREVLTPMLSSNLFPGDTSRKGSPRIESNGYNPTYDIGSGKTLERSHAGSEYVELQFWGPLNLDNVKAFLFKRVPPEGSFLKALRDRGITIYDGRNDNLKIWKDDILEKK